MNKSLQEEHQCNPNADLSILLSISETPVPPEVMPADQPELPELPQPPQPESSQPEEMAEHTAETQDTSGAAPYPTALEEGDDEEGELPVDFDRLWRVAHDNPQEFSSWTDLLQYCEQEVSGD